MQKAIIPPPCLGGGILFHFDFTAGALRFHSVFLFLHYKNYKEGLKMFLGLAWYWWVVTVVLLVVSIPFKIKFTKWWSKRQQEKKKEQRGKWGEDE